EPCPEASREYLAPRSFGGAFFRPGQPDRNLMVEGCSWPRPAYRTAGMSWILLRSDTSSRCSSHGLHGGGHRGAGACLLVEPSRLAWSCRGDRGAMLEIHPTLTAGQRGRAADRSETQSLTAAPAKRGPARSWRRGPSLTSQPRKGKPYEAANRIAPVGELGID